MPAALSIDPLLDRIPTASYNCLDFAIEAWRYLSGDPEAAERLERLSEGVRAEDGHVILSGVRGFTKLDRPRDPCLVVMQRTRTSPHIGIFLRGRVLHLKECGVEYQPIQVVRRYFTRIGFYA
jgi:hypothetical protein